MGGPVEEPPVAEASGPSYLAGVDLQPTYNGGVGLIFELSDIQLSALYDLGIELGYFYQFGIFAYIMAIFPKWDAGRPGR